MNLQIRLFRKPFTTVLWVTLVTAMTVLLCIGGALWYSSESVVGIIDDLHITIAARTNQNCWSEDQPGGYGLMVYEDKTFSPEDVEAFESLDCVEKVYFHTLSAATSPSFRPLYSIGADSLSDECYSDIMVVGEIVALSPVESFTEQLTGETFHIIDATLLVEEYVLKNGDFVRTEAEEDPYLNIGISLPEQEMTEYLQIGQRYVCFGKYEPIRFDGNGIEAHPWIWISDEAALVDDCIRIIYGKDRSQEPAKTIYGPAIMKRIEGSFEEFLKDPANALHAEMVERWEKQQHALPVMGTDNLDAMYAFANNNANITSGRSFTDEEYASGAKVCILSETLANHSGIQVGDTITMEQFTCHDWEFNLNHNRSVHGSEGVLSDPNVGRYNMLIDFAPAEEFTVVGLYRQANDWAGTAYSFTANTVFIPKAAQIADTFGGPSVNFDATQKTFSDESGTMAVDLNAGTYGIYFSMKLKNGCVSEFQELMDQDERFADQFLTVDQGFGSIQEAIQGIAESARQLLSLVAAGWALLLLLYILLYQGMQKRNLGIMRSLGATPKESGCYLWASGMAVAVTGIALGTAISAGVMSFVQKMLFDAATYDVPLTKFSTGGEMSQTMLEEMLQRSQLSLPMLLALAAVQIAIFAAVLWLHAIWLAKKEPRTLLNP